MLKKSNFLFKKFSQQTKTNTNQSTRTLLLDSEQSIKYYRLNIYFLTGYLAYSGISLRSQELPSYMKSSILMFSCAASIILAGLFIYSNRHIRKMTLIKRNRVEEILEIENFRLFGFVKPKTIEIKPSQIREINPINKYLPFRHTGLYIMRFRDTKIFPIINCMIMRPNKHNTHFDKIFIPKLKK